MAALLVLAAGLWFVVDTMESRLVRADPDSLRKRDGLTRFAVTLGSLHYGAHCALCHGADGKGDPARGVPNLTDRDWLYGSGRASEIERVIAFGIRSHNPKAWNLAEMPAFARVHPSAAEPKIPPLSPAEIRDVVEYLRYVEGRPGNATAVSHGSALYHDRGGCYDCHGQDAAGDSSIGAPNLTDRIWLYGDGGRASMFASIARGHAGVCPAWIGHLRPAVIRETALYVYSFSHPELVR